MGFKPFTPGYVLMPASVELGEFSCYEVKSCMADFKSGHGLTFYGDVNYLVTTRELAEERVSRNSFPATRTICRKRTCVAATRHRLTPRSKPWREN